MAPSCWGQRGHIPQILRRPPKFLIGSTVISLSRCCLPNDEGPAPPPPPNIFFLEPPLALNINEFFDLYSSAVQMFSSVTGFCVTSSFSVQQLVWSTRSACLWGVYKSTANLSDTWWQSLLSWTSRRLCFLTRVAYYVIIMAARGAIVIIFIIMFCYGSFFLSLVYSSLFSAQQHICYSALYAIARPSVCPSVCPSVRHTGGSVKDGWS